MSGHLSFRPRDVDGLIIRGVDRGEGTVWEVWNGRDRVWVELSGRVSSSFFMSSELTPQDLRALGIPDAT